MTSTSRRFAPDMIERARRLAAVAHRGQFDKGHRPYFEHPQRVATYMQLTGLWCGLEPEEQFDGIVAAWLHDVIEDTSYTVGDLKKMGFSARSIEIVVLLTRTKAVSADEYYALIADHKIARAAKWADMIDNTDPTRLAKLPEVTSDRLTEKYDRGAACLKISPTPNEWWTQQALWGPSNQMTPV